MAEQRIRILTPEQGDTRFEPLGSVSQLSGQVATKAPLNSPALTGTPTAPTAAIGTSNTQVATTSFVQTAANYRLLWRSTWTATTAYAVNDVVKTSDGRVWTCMTPHTSGTTFSSTNWNPIGNGTDPATLATLASPTFTGTPAAPTAAAGTSTTQVATTAFVTTADALKAPLASPALTGVPTAPTAAVTDSTNQIATTSLAGAKAGLRLRFIGNWTASTAYAANDVVKYAYQVYVCVTAHTSTTSFDGANWTQLAYYDLTDYAPKNSPAFIGTPTAPTATTGTSTTQVATTAFVSSAVTSAATPDATTTSKGTVQLAGDLGGTAAAPTVPALANKANVASPTFTGTPSAPTAASGTNTTQIATTAFVSSAVSVATGATPPPDATTTSRGLVQLAGDLAGTATAPTVPGLAAKAPLASPTFTGTPLAPTAPIGDNTSTIATTSFVATNAPRQYTPYDGQGTARYQRLATIDGKTTANGADITLLIGGLGNYGSSRRGTAIVELTQRGTNPGGLTGKVNWLTASVTSTGVAFYYISTGSLTAELWMLTAPYQTGHKVTVLASWNATMTMDGPTTTAPAGLVAIDTTADMESMGGLSAAYMTSAQRTALAGTDLWAGRLVTETDTGIQWKYISSGTGWKAWESGDWIGYTPGITGVAGTAGGTPGWAVQYAQYRYVSGQVFVRGSLYLNGGTASVNGQIVLTMPVAYSNRPSLMGAGQVKGIDASDANAEYMLLHSFGGSGGTNVWLGYPTTNGKALPTNPGVPFAWGQSDTIAWQLIYDPA